MDTDSWEDAMSNALRQSPDAILIGEIRDRETMEYALAFAESGHLTLATLHANNANQALDRIINFFPSDKQKSSSGPVAQHACIRIAAPDQHGR
jgi:twitching motility protein PilU